MLRGHARDGLARDDEQAEHVDGEDALQPLQRHVWDQGLVVDRGVVDDGGDRSKLVVDRFQHPQDVVFFAHIGLDRDGALAGVPDVGRDLLRPIPGLGVVDGDIVALGAGEPRDGGADPAAAARNDHDLGHTPPPDCSVLPARAFTQRLTRAATSGVVPSGTSALSWTTSSNCLSIQLASTAKPHAS